MRAARLTRREKQVRDLLLQGYENKEVGESLGISHRTVEEHRANLLGKYSVRNTVELMRAVYHIEGAPA